MGFLARQWNYICCRWCTLWFAFNKEVWDNVYFIVNFNIINDDISTDIWYIKYWLSTYLASFSARVCMRFSASTQVIERLERLATQSTEYAETIICPHALYTCLYTICLSIVKPIALIFRCIWILMGLFMIMIWMDVTQEMKFYEYLECHQ